MALLAGCGGGNKGSIQANGQTLSIQDMLYTSAPQGRFCQGFALDQVQLTFDDFSPDCKYDFVGKPNPRDNTVSHSAVQIVLAFGGNPTATAAPYSPFTFDASADCVNGGADAIANFLVYPPGDPTMTTPQITKADHGSITITRYDRMNKLSMTGSYDLFFGGQESKGTIDALNCD
jgi:hypothetical protein